METERIKKLADAWFDVTDSVIRFEKPSEETVGSLFKESYEILSQHRDDELVPKEISGLLIEMNNFGWWVSDLNETPWHNRYQEIVSLVFDLKKYFLHGIGQQDAIEEAIANIYEQSFQ